MQDQNSNVIDPDPYVIAGLAIAGAALVLQFVQVFRDSSKSNSTPSSSPNLISSQQSIEISQLRAELTMARQHFRNATKAIERGAQNLEIEFYQAKIRVSETSLRLDNSQYFQFSTNLGQAFARIWNTSMFINNLIAHHPPLAAQIGKLIDEGCPNAAEHINKLLAEGGETRRVLSETNRILDVFEDVVKKLDEGN